MEDEGGVAYRMTLTVRRVGTTADAGFHVGAGSDSRRRRGFFIDDDDDDDGFRRRWWFSTALPRLFPRRSARRFARTWCTGRDRSRLSDGPPQMVPIWT